MPPTKRTTPDEPKDLATQIAAEFKAQGFLAHTRDVVRLTDALEAQGADLDEVAIMAACTGYISAKRGG